ncbi:MAG: response regulator [Chloroflexota bacterium]|nr:response regulator [Chloroflexota bacterium]
MTSPERTPLSRPSHVLVVDGDRRVRQSVSDLIAAAEDLELTDAVADTSSALASLALRPAHIVLIDPHLPDEAAGLALMETLRDDRPDLALVVMSCSARVGLRSMALGAVAFVPKTGDPESLVDVLRRASDGRTPH